MERGRQSRQRILQAAEMVFGDRGYFPASIADIVREAGVAQGTFHLYFRSKQHVFTELHEFLARTAREAMRVALEDAREIPAARPGTSFTTLPIEKLRRRTTREERRG